VNHATVGSTNLIIDNKIPAGAGFATGQTVGTLAVSAPVHLGAEDVAAFSEPHIRPGTTWPGSISKLTGDGKRLAHHDTNRQLGKSNATLLADEFGGRLVTSGFIWDISCEVAIPAIVDRAPP
jgi:hypothetical protein